MATKTEVTNVKNQIPDSDAFVRKTDYSSEISGIKNDYVNKTSLTSKLDNLKTTHIAHEVKKVDDKAAKNTSDILGFETRLVQKEDTLNNVQREASFGRRFCYYNQSYFLFESKSKSYNRNGGVINSWISTGIHNDSKNTDLFSVKDLPQTSSSITGFSPTLLNQNNRLVLHLGVII